MKQEKSSMVYQVLKATWENPTKNDFVMTCQEYLNILDIKLTFQEIEKMSQWSFKKLVKAKTEAAGLKYLQDQISKQTKASAMKYSDLRLQEYFIGGNCNKKLSRIIFKARSQTLDIKSQQKCRQYLYWVQEILLCDALNNDNRMAATPINYNWFYRNSVSDIVKAGKILDNGMKVKQRILESGIT